MITFAAFLFDRPESVTLSRLANNPREALLLIMAIFFAASVATAWILMMRKLRWYRRHRHVHRRHRLDVTQTSTANTGKPENVSSSTHTHKRRRERYTRRNPTLAETGGLPQKRAKSAEPQLQSRQQLQQPYTTPNE